MLEIVEESVERLDEYARIPIRFLVNSRYGVGPVEPYWKDYDEHEEERPTWLPARFDIANWAILAAYLDGRRVGGAIVAWNSPDFDMLQGRTDLAVLADIRVDPAARGQGVGKALFEASSEWARTRGCTEMIVETQDVNEPACRFYRAMGCDLISSDPNGYGEDIDEAKLIWRLHLRPAQ